MKAAKSKRKADTISVADAPRHRPETDVEVARRRRIERENAAAAAAEREKIESKKARVREIAKFLESFTPEYKDEIARKVHAAVLDEVPRKYSTDEWDAIEFSSRKDNVVEKMRSFFGDRVDAFISEDRFRIVRSASGKAWLALAVFLRDVLSSCASRPSGLEVRVYSELDLESLYGQETESGYYASVLVSGIEKP